MQDKKRRFSSVYSNQWRKKALHELEKVWIKLKSPPKNREIERLLAESNIDFPKAKDFIESRLASLTVIDNADHDKKIRKTRSTVPCHTDNLKNKKQTLAIKPNGYKQKSRKSESINLDNFYETWTWKDLRYQVIKKYGRRCMNCGQSPSKENKVSLHVDHIKSIRKHPELALDINNLQVLCNDCNQGKGYWDETDFR